MGACWLSANWGMLMGDLLKVFFLQRIRVFWVLPLVLLVCHGRWPKTLQDFAKWDQEMKCKMKILQLTDVESFAMTRFVRPALREGTINTQRNLQSSTLQCNDGAGFCWYLKTFSVIMKWNSISLMMTLPKETKVNKKQEEGKTGKLRQIPGNFF